MLRVTFRCFKQIRYMSRRKGIVKTSNPGVENRLQIFKMETTSIDDVEDDDMDVDELESDFSQVGEVHREYEREKIKAARIHSFVVTKDKYFKEAKLPNLLTWSEKEQIKYLHQLDPKEWDAESLSKSFPSTPNVIKKILKSKWKPKDGNALERHDKAVERNWILLKEGKFNLEEELRCHFLKFSSRKSNVSLSEFNHNKPTIVCNRPQKTEFVNLLSTRARKLDENSMEKTIEVDIPELLTRKINPEQKSDSFVLPSYASGNREMISFTEFKKCIELEIADSKLCSTSDKSPEDHLSGKSYAVESEAPNDNVPETTNVKSAKKLIKYKQESVEENLTTKQLDVFLKADNYEHKIKVPEGKKDPLSVYKVSDCFYDYDGSFLYRVPGMK